MTGRWPHQIADTRLLLERPAFALWHDMGLGKSRITTDAICEAVRAGHIDGLIVVCPAFARSVWADPDPLLGEWAKWATVPSYVTEYCARRDRMPVAGVPGLPVVVTNYEFLRRKERLGPLVQWAAARNTWLVLDESWAVQNPRAEQAKACYLLRQACERVTLLNGTPGPPENLFSQFQILDSRILGVKNYHHFRAKYCIMGGWQNKKIVGYQQMDDFKARTAPYALRREMRDCLDLPPVLPPLTIEARLSPEEWTVYTTMRDELVVWLNSAEASIASQAGVRTLRLAQVLAGFLGGVQTMEGDVEGPPEPVRAVGDAKLRAVMAWAEHAPSKWVLWGRFRAELARYAECLHEAGRQVHLLWGSQDPAERDTSKRAFAPGSEVEAAVLVGNPQAGGAGINLASASVAVYATNSFSLKDRQQSEGRLNRPGQTSSVRFVDVVAVGPSGQKTLDHVILQTLREKTDVAEWTARTWRDKLTEE